MLTYVVTTLCRRKYVLSELHWEMPIGSLHLISPGILPVHNFSLMILLGIISVRNHSCEFDYMLSCVSPSESANWGGLLDADPEAMFHVSLAFPTDYMKHLFVIVFAICLSTLVKCLS